MPPDAPENKPTDVPTQIFEAFLTSLAGSDVSEEIVTRLRKTLLVDKSFSEAALRKAISGDQQS